MRDFTNIHKFQRLSLLEFLEGYKDFYIIFEVGDPDDEYNLEYDNLDEFKNSGFAFLLDEIVVGKLTSIKMFPHSARIKIYYR